jgi:hypothetical protein
MPKYRVMRVIGYPDLRNIADNDRVGVSCGEHTGDKLIILNVLIIVSYTEKFFF